MVAKEKDDVHNAYYQVETPRLNEKNSPTAIDSKEGVAVDASGADKHTSGDDGSFTFHFRDLYRFATPFDKFLLVCGIIFSTANGALFPLIALLFGNAIGSFEPLDIDSVNTTALEYFGLSILIFIASYGSYVCFHITAERQMKYLRYESLKHILHQEMGWYDERESAELATRINGDTVKILEGMGYKLGEVFKYSAQLICGYIIGFIKGWQMSFVMIAVMPFTAISIGFVFKKMKEGSIWTQKVYAKAGAVAEETLGSMRTISSLNGEKFAMKRYNERADNAERENIKLDFYIALSFAWFFASMWLTNGAGLWFGGWKVSEGDQSPSEIFSAYYGILMGNFGLAQISPNITAVSEARGSAVELYKILARRSQIDASSEDGIIPESCSGEIEVKNVDFKYPSRPDVQIMKNYSLKINSGETVALAGPSGGGKSTLIGLLERFYDPDHGTIYLDGIDIRSIQIKWLRSQIGLVSQEPILFATSVKENIASGGENPSDEEIYHAAKLANAHEFIMKLPYGYDTKVGEKGVSLSGGQKQRIAIARAIIRHPKILILDEATSALDAESEKTVQAALNQLVEKTTMTTIVIAHRLSTIRNATKIAVVNNGCVAELGPHEELMKIENGLYKSLVEIQGGDEDKDFEEEVAAVENQRQQSDHFEGLSKNIDADNQMEIHSTDSTESVKLGKRTSAKRVLSLSYPEKKYLVGGVIACCINGIAIPIQAVLITQVLTSMTSSYATYQTTNDKADLVPLYHTIRNYGIAFLCASVGILCINFLQNYYFKIMADKLVTRLRKMNFRAFVRQNIAFFDEDKHASGALAADLATNPTTVAIISGESQGRVIQGFFTLVAALVISFIFGSWELSLIMLVIFPFLCLGHVLRMKQMKKSLSVTTGMGESGARVTEAIGNVRTVAAFGLEKKLTDEYFVLLESPFKEGVRDAHKSGFGQGFSFFIMFGTYALVFYVGGIFVEHDISTFKRIMMTLMAIMMSSMSVGDGATYLGDLQKSIRAAKSVFGVVDREPPIDSFNEGGEKLEEVKGNIEFENVSFNYPTRPDVTVLKNYDLKIDAGSTVAFCGPSGGGKSTGIALLERFYDPDEGRVLLDGHDIKTLNLTWLRSNIALVGQEPTLFVGTIAENIAYGMPADAPDLQQRIEEAAKMSNAHDFISAFPDGYNTQVGSHGEQLSGGQKQRIAIARAIIKNPQILLLDEATSALDSESEKIVQEAIDKIVETQNCTTLIIAHRLSTIRNADQICVVSGGKVAEKGTHSELLSRGGIYHRLVSSQMKK